MKKKRLKIKNVVKLFVFILCVYMILHDLYMITLHGYITGQHCGWTWLGFMTFILFCVIAGFIYEDFEEQIKRVSTLETVKHSSK